MTLLWWTTVPTSTLLKTFQCFRTETFQKSCQNQKGQAAPLVTEAQGQHGLWTQRRWWAIAALGCPVEESTRALANESRESKQSTISQAPHVVSSRTSAPSTSKTSWTSPAIWRTMEMRTSHPSLWSRTLLWVLTWLIKESHTKSNPPRNQPNPTATSRTFHKIKTTRISRT